jgi:hypothetical protein
VKLIDDLRAGRPVKVNNQNAVRTCEGPVGQTSLNGEPPGPFSRDLAALLAEEKRRAEAAAKAKAEEAAALKAAAAAGRPPAK